MKKLKDLLKESYVWDRKFGESLPTLKQIEAKYRKKLNEGAKHGFDLTDFKRNGFKQLLKALKIRPKAQLDRNESGWEWKGNGITIVTGNNPLTGEYASAVSGKSPIKDAYEASIEFPGIPILAPVPWPNSSGMASTVIEWKAGEWNLLRSGAVVLNEN